MWPARKRLRTSSPTADAQISFALSASFTFSLAPVYIGALALTALAVWQVTATARRWSSRAGR
jgi:hypothetical protein